MNEDILSQEEVDALLSDADTILSTLRDSEFVPSPELAEYDRQEIALYCTVYRQKKLILAMARKQRQMATEIAELRSYMDRIGEDVDQALIRMGDAARVLGGGR